MSTATLPSCPPNSDAPAIVGERRASVRFPFDCPVRWSTGGVDRTGWSRDASDIGAGFSVRSLCLPRVGQTIRLVFELDPGMEWVVDEAAAVCRCDEAAPGLWDVGVELTPVDLP